MAQLIALIIFIFSFLGITVILFRKIPFLINLPVPQGGKSTGSLLSKVGEQIKNTIPLKEFSLEKFLENLLNKTTIFIRRIEKQMTIWLQNIRQQSKSKEQKKDDNYWEEIKNIKSDKNFPL